MKYANGNEIFKIQKQHTRIYIYIYIYTKQSSDNFLSLKKEKPVTFIHTFIEQEIVMTHASLLSSHFLFTPVNQNWPALLAGSFRPAQCGIDNAIQNVKRLPTSVCSKTMVSESNGPSSLFRPPGSIR